MDYGRQYTGYYHKGIGNIKKNPILIWDTYKNCENSQINLLYPPHRCDMLGVCLPVEYGLL
jgi:hypothetical protein